MTAALALSLGAAAGLAQDEYVPEEGEPPPQYAPAPSAEPAPGPVPQPGPAPERPDGVVVAPAITSGDTVAVLQGLDKVTGRVSTIDAPMRTPVSFGTLEIIPHACYKTPPEEQPEAAAFLEIAEVKPDEPRRELFTGWMFASSPALSALEHPVYDVWVLDCKSLSSAPSGRAGRSMRRVASTPIRGPWRRSAGSPTSV